MSIQTALAHLGITVNETVKGKIATVDIPHVIPEREGELISHILKINQALQDVGLLGQWRAKKGGTTRMRWILLIGAKR